MRWVFLFFMFLLAACSLPKKAYKSYRMGEYQKAIQLYSQVLAQQPNHPRAAYYIAESYRLSNRLREAEPFYAKATSPQLNQDSVQFFYAKSLQANGKYDSAQTQLKQLDVRTTNARLKQRIKVEMTNLDNAQKLEREKNFYQVKNMESINTPYAEYAPVYSNGELYFTSSRSNDALYQATGTPFTDLYKVTTKGAVIEDNTLAPLPKEFNDKLINEGCAAFTPDGKTMVFAKGNSGSKKGAKDVDLYISRFRDGQWTAPTPININLPDAWESTPAFAADGKTLYFSSNRRGGLGGTDLYAATMDGRGRFGNVRNLGATINTAGNELFPYASETGKIYFSSDGWPGFGLLDIFEVKRVKGKTVAQNLGKPVNSEADDFGYFLFKADRGFFCSNRSGGKGDDDIYTFINNDPDLKVVKYTLNGITYGQTKNGRELLPNAKVTLFDAERKAMENTKTTAEGKFSFEVFENENYELTAEATGYLVKRGKFTTIGKGIPKDSLKELVTYKAFDTLLVLEALEKNKIFVLDNIYFDYDKSDIRPDAATELDKLVTILNDNPEIKIEMRSHTDSIASDSYNLQLSQRRAESTVRYLITQGIDNDRLTARGYGESLPVAPNSKPDGSDNPEGRAKNRRTEFKILDIGEGKKTEEDVEEDKFFKDELKKKKDEKDEE